MLQNLAKVSITEQTKFIKSFDHVFCDIDGVIWLACKAIPGAPECVDTLKEIGKKVTFITNYGASSTAELYRLLREIKVSAELDDIVNPLLAMILHLKKIKFDKEIFAIGTAEFKDELKRSGFKLAPDPPQFMEETIPNLLSNMADDEKVGAVVFDYDINLTILKLQKSLTYLKRKDCLFMIGGAEKSTPFGNEGPLVGNYYFYMCLKEISGREPIQMAKPSIHYVDLVTEKFHVKKPGRILYIGDNIEEDMGFAMTAGYEKLLVLTGTTKNEHLLDWKYPENLKPQYYVESLGALNDIIKLCNISKISKD
ncbi:unnamed protein product [Phaedon cochleariae]|uniref:4-nitrophenylphosphatase n=1 Tax=Phaedon cochleariae TaxID=80249 RepID=A0A9P0DNS5_PHACE|nr:unnamed protein product [Phaedon cochleariae]